MIQEDNDLIAFGAKKGRKARKYDLDEEMSHEASILVREVIYSPFILFYFTCALLFNRYFRHLLLFIP